MSTMPLALPQRRFGRFWSGLSSGQKLLLILIAVVIAWYLYNVIKARINAEEKAIENRAEIDVLKDKGVKATYGNDTYARFADVLENSMDGAGTKTDMVFKTFSYLNNNVDFIKLDSAFGVREASDNFFGLLESEDLKGWVRGDLSSSEVSKLNAQLRNKGITKQI